jgi:hypothetical protein
MRFLRCNWNYLAAIAFVVAAGAFRGAEDIRLFAPQGNVFYESLSSPADADWYQGGNDRYNPSLPWTADFWHRMKHFEMISWALAIAFASRRWWPGAAYFVYGWSFTLFYHYFWHLVPDGTFWEILGWLIWPFNNFH